MNRRYFLMGATGALASSQMKSHSLVSPNDTVRLAVVGVRGQGKSHLNQYSQMKNVEIAAICDTDESILTITTCGRAGKSLILLTYEKIPGFTTEIRRKRLVLSVAP